MAAGDSRSRSLSFIAIAYSIASALTSHFHLPFFDRSTIFYCTAAFSVTAGIPRHASSRSLFATMLAGDSDETLLPTVTTCSSRAKKLFCGQNVLLTGASGGLGRALALQLASCGASTLILSGRNAKALNETAVLCRNVSSRRSSSNPRIDIHTLTCDLSNATCVSELASDTLHRAGGKIDILINNAGVSSRSSFLDTKFDVDELVMRINFLSGVSLAKALVPGMVKRNNGAVVWISGIQGRVGIPGRTSNVASKFAIQGYCEALRGELASSGVAVHVASPGYIRTNLSYSALCGNGEAYGKMDETTAKGANPNQVAVSILNAVACGKADFVVASTMSSKAAIWLRLAAPSFLRRMLTRRYQKMIRDEKQKAKETG